MRTPCLAFLVADSACGLLQSMAFANANATRGTAPGDKAKEDWLLVQQSATSLATLQSLRFIKDLEAFLSFRKKIRISTLDTKRIGIRATNQLQSITHIGKTLWDGQAFGMLSDLASQARLWKEDESTRPLADPTPGPSGVKPKKKRTKDRQSFLWVAAIPNSQEYPSQEGCDESRTCVSRESGIRGCLHNTRIPEQRCKGPWQPSPGVTEGPRPRGTLFREKEGNRCISSPWGS